MSRVVFLGLPCIPHTNPTFGWVKELVNQGEEVIYYTVESLRETIEKTGAVFQSYQEIPGQPPNDRGVSFEQLMKHSIRIMQDNTYVANCIFDGYRGKKPDYIIYDTTALWGKIIAQRWNIPSISSSCTFTYTEAMLDKEFEYVMTNIIGMHEDYLKDPGQTIRMIRSLQQKIGKLFNFENFGYFATGSINLVYTSKLFQPFAEYFDDSYKFVGPQLYNRNDVLDFPVEILADSLIYITMGTTFNKKPDFYLKCFEALKEIELQVVMAVGKDFDISTLGSIPNHFIVKNYVPQLEVIQRAKLLITAGGLGTVSESIYYGTPLMVCPQGADQFLVANQIEKFKVGVRINNETSAEEIKLLATRMLNDDQYRENLALVGDSFRAAGGVRRAVEEVLKFKEKYGIQ
ncbi:MAG TPA: macrolide family glycosyltransferase [Bacillota bacterium]|nr:macrolide family glycosyltransferase [Bacillota bacterium]